MNVANPFFRAYPEWRPEALPATRTNGPVALTLTELEIRPVLWGYHVSTPSGTITTRVARSIRNGVARGRFS